jgi:hypothetical protein
MLDRVWEQYCCLVLTEKKVTSSICLGKAALGFGLPKCGSWRRPTFLARRIQMYNNHSKCRFEYISASIFPLYGDQR